MGSLSEFRKSQFALLGLPRRDKCLRIANARREGKEIRSQWKAVGSAGERNNCRVTLWCRPRIRRNYSGTCFCRAPRLRERVVSMHARPPASTAQLLRPQRPLRQSSRDAKKKVGAKLFGPHFGREKKFRTHFRSRYGRRRGAHDFLSLNYFFTKLTALNSSFAYFTYNSNVEDKIVKSEGNHQKEILDSYSLTLEFFLVKHVHISNLVR